ncbi:MAG TPA: ABC transporter ATP-binding protein [candidate division WOR-3 bacterium]|uniref:ABC transporter ATP-binding protein n=1 Tax=candidate division WOR-3 bacterium TaxID=2052148 RepID=A0A7C5DCZ2_UNCW3|nr:ABC transporter ATP-binding protein [Candidatus Aminicenantes bacterium]HHE04599.1 ABC transporter ATP-binding protein [candidate division WOR-3 bacterium]
MKSLVKLLKNYRGRIFIALIYSSLAALFTATAALVLQPIMDNLFSVAPTHKAQGFQFGEFLSKYIDLSSPYAIPLLVLFVFFGKAFFTFLSNYTTRALAQKVVRDLRERIFSILIEAPLKFFDSFHSGKIASRFLYEMDILERSISDGVVQMIRESLTVLALVVVIITNNPRFTLISIAIIPVAAVPVIIFGRIIKKLTEKRQKSIGEISRQISETLGGIRVVKAFSTEAVEREKFTIVNQKNYLDNIKFVKIWTLSSPFLEFIGGFVAAILIYISARMIRQGLMTPGQFTTFIASIFYLYTPIRRLSSANNILHQGGAAVDSLEELINQGEKYREKEGDYKPSDIKGEIEFRDVYFSYNKGKPVLRGISFKLNPGEKMAIVGSSGVGKTTIVNLILGFYTPDSGKVLIDGVDVGKYDLKWLRRRIGVVTQDVLLFNATIAENIKYGTENASFDQILKAAKAAHIHDYIDSLPEGYDTNLSERGFNLSLGQRQRISIARAIIKDPKILIFDEATSSLDSESEQKIQEALREITRDRTTIIIAHRLSTVKMADKIIVLENGKIVEQGAHEELMRKNGKYAHFYRVQMEG